MFEDEGACCKRCKPAADRIESLREGEAEGCRMLRAEGRDVGIGRRLQDGNAGTDDEDAAEEEPEIWQACRGNKHERANDLDKKRDDDSLLVADCLNQPGGRRRDDKVSREKREVGQSSLEPGEIKDRFQMRHEGHVQSSDEPEDEVEGRNGDEWANVTGLAIGLALRRRGVDLVAMCNSLPLLNLYWARKIQFEVLQMLRATPGIFHIIHTIRIAL